MKIIPNFVKRGYRATASYLSSMFKEEYILTYKDLDSQTIVNLEQNVIKQKNRNLVVTTLVIGLLSGGVLLIPMLMFYKGYVKRKDVYKEHGVDPSTVPGK